MRLTSKAEYALRAMVFLAENQEKERPHARQIAERQTIPYKFLAQIMRDLRQAGIVKSVRGPQGGVRLARAADEINLLEIVEAVEGPLNIYTCVVGEGICEMQVTCPICEVLGETQEKIEEVFGGTNLAQMVASKAAKTGR